MNTAKAKVFCEDVFTPAFTLKPGTTLAEFLNLHRDTKVCKLPLQIGVTRQAGQTRVEFRS